MLFKVITKRMIIKRGTAEDFSAQFNGDERLRPMLYEHFANGNGEIIEAILGKMLIGRLYIFKELEDKAAADGKTVAYISSVCVRKPFQNLGIGTRLMESAHERLSELGYSAATIGVEEENEGAVRLYNRLGYTQFLKKSNVDLILVNKRGEHKPTEEYMILKNTF